MTACRWTLKISSDQFIEISDSRDPRVAAFTSVRERDLTSGHGARFIVEGKVTLETLLTRSRFQIESLFLCETRLSPLAGLLSHLPKGVPIYVAPQTVMDAVAGFPIHRGILACGLKGDTLSATDIAKTAPAPLLMLAGLSNHDNVGACFRNAAAFGAGGVLLDAQSCDPLYRKAIRVSSGSSLWLPYSHGGRDIEMVNAVQDAGYTVWALTPHEDAKPLNKMPVPKKLALMLGSEGPGLSNEIIAAAMPVRIPMSDGFDSVNVATAGAIALAHVFSG